MTSQDNAAQLEHNKRVVAKFFDGTHSGRLEVIDETVDQHIVTYGFPGGCNPRSREEYKQFFIEFGNSFSNMHYDVLSMVAEGDQVAVRWSIDVDHTGAFAGVQPTGRRVHVTGVVVYRLANGLIVETWLFIDELALLAGIGALPAEAA